MPRVTGIETAVLVYILSVSIIFTEASSADIFKASQRPNTVRRNSPSVVETYNRVKRHPARLRKDEIFSTFNTTESRATAHLLSNEKNIQREDILFLKHHGFKEPILGNFPIPIEKGIEFSHPFSQAFALGVFFEKDLTSKLADRTSSSITLRKKQKDVARSILQQYVDRDGDGFISASELNIQFQKKRSFENKLRNIFSNAFRRKKNFLDFKALSKSLIEAQSNFWSCAPDLSNDSDPVNSTQAGITSNTTFYPSKSKQSSKLSLLFFLCPKNWKLKIQQNVAVEVPSFLFNVYNMAYMKESRQLLLNILGYPVHVGFGNTENYNEHPYHHTTSKILRMSGVQLCDHRRNGNCLAHDSSQLPPLLWYALQNYPLDADLLDALLFSYRASRKANDRGLVR